MKVAIILIALFGVAAATPIGSVCGRSDTGFKPDTNCRLYYQCSHGAAYSFSCPENLYFNDVTSSCDFRENVPVCKNGVRPIDNATPEEPTPEEPVPEVPAPEEPKPVVPIPEEPRPEDPLPVDPLPEEPQPEEPAVPEEPKPEPEAPVVPPGDGKCPSGPYYYLPNPADSNSFFICQNGQQSGSGKCGQNLRFDERVQGCVQ